MVCSKVLSGWAGVWPNTFGGRNKYLQQSGFDSKVPPQKSWLNNPQESNNGKQCRIPFGDTWPFLKRQNLSIDTLLIFDEIAMGIDSECVLVLLCAVAKGNWDSVGCKVMMGYYVINLVGWNCWISVAQWLGQQTQTSKTPAKAPEWQFTHLCHKECQPHPS